MNNNQPSASAKWLYDSPVNSEVEAKLRRFLVELGNADHKILGIQVCAYKDGKVIIDTAAGVLGIDDDDPRPVHPDSLFPVFSTTKGVTAGLVHWLVDKGKLKLDDNVANIWPEFGTNGKDQIKVNHILNHTAGLHNALAGISVDDFSLFCDFSECIKRITAFSPETEPGNVQSYHYLSFGWLCGGIVEHASGEKFQEILEEAFVRPLNVEGEFYIGIPSGVESRLATLTIDEDELNLMAKLFTPGLSTFMPSTFTFGIASNLITISNTINVRRAILPAANGHFSARALARYYATLVDGGVVPPSHSPSKKTTNGIDTTKIFNNSKEKIHDAFLGLGDYKDLIVPNGMFGLGFNRVNTTDGSIIGFGHEGFGGSTGYCDISNRFAISVTVNKLSMGALTGEIIYFICSELDLPVPKGYNGSRGDIKKPVIN
uniref:beta-lactamase domain-containing protein 2-like n=1 Tax=Erigeron canadensis TaxID=72917 RepID=UPI001CB8F7AE|nr:beta-lactamase domain-containing protein 2-like [Erigeron canadensis]